jgi:hypothetical protein
MPQAPHKNGTPNKCGCPIFAAALSPLIWAIVRKHDPFSFNVPKDVPTTVAKKKIVISTQATDSLTVRCAVEKPPHSAFAVAYPPQNPFRNCHPERSGSRTLRTVQSKDLHLPPSLQQPQLQPQPHSHLPLGNPRLVAQCFSFGSPWTSLSAQTRGALAPGVCPPSAQPKNSHLPFSRQEVA